MESLLLTNDELILRHQDLLKFIEEGIKDRKIRIKDTVIRTTDKVTDSRSNCKKYNTCIISNRPFGEECKLYVNIDKSYSYTDIYRLAKQYVTFADYKTKQDAFQLGTLVNYNQHRNKKDAFMRGVANFKEMKSMEEK